MAKSIKTPLAAVGAAFLATSVVPSASAEVNPFSANPLDTGFNTANYASHKEGGCGEDRHKGDKHKGDKEGKCGEGKCGEGKKADKEGKCGEGKCGEGKKAGKEGKCGEGKCGG